MKLVSVNIEGDKHLNTVVPFLTKETPDVICLQEIFESDALDFAKQFSMEYAYAPMTLRTSLFPEKGGEPRSHGIAILSKNQFTGVFCETYYSSGNDLQIFDISSPESIHKTIQRKLLYTDIEAEGQIFRIGTTHFTWTPNGLPTDYQSSSADALLAVLASAQELALVGDFNIPRGTNVLYEKFAARFTDAIPQSYTGSLDMDLHRLKDDPMNRPRMEKFMVDYLFLTKKYSANNVRLEKGVSDHCAVVATLATHA